jgi:hypothetical protein
MPFPLVLALTLTQAVPDPAPPAAQTTEDSAGDRQVPLLVNKDDPGRACTADARWCVSLAQAEDGDAQILPVIRAGAAPGPSDPPPSEDASANETYAVWPSLVLLKQGGFLAGVETRTSTAYSGGGGSGTELRLFRIAADGQAAAKPVLTVAVDGSLLIRACFGEKDMKQRRGACHDEYRFSGALSLARETAAGLPILAYATDAQAYPRGVSRFADSTTMPRLKKSDLVYARDPECSFTRQFRFDPATGTYAPDAALPDCSAYTAP